MIVAHAALAWACTPSMVVEAAPPSTDAADRCVTGDLDVAARAFARSPDEGISRGVAVARFRGEAGFRAEDFGVRTAFLVARSAGDEGYLGIQGEAWVPVLQIAEVRYDHRAWGLAIAAGAVDDVALMPIQGAWNRVDVARPMLTDRGWTTRSDLGGWLSWTTPGEWLTITASTTAGEGIDRRDRNNGLTTTGVVHVRPLGDRRLTVMAWGREGSRGLLSAPDHRVGGAIWTVTPLVVAGVDATLGEGLAGDGALQPGGVSAWARTGDQVPAVAWARVDRGSDARTIIGAASTAAFVGGGPRLPWRAGGTGYLAVGWEGRRSGPAATALAGAPVGQRTDTWLIQLGGRFLGGLDLESR